jgi:hypothetical protein
MTTSDLISGVAVVLSFLSVVASVIIYLNQKKYIQNQDRLNALLLRKEQAELESEGDAEVSANVVPIGTSKYRIRIFNKGKAKATDVQIRFPEDHDWLIKDEILPLEFLDSGKSVDLILMLFAGSKRKVKAILSWQDHRGRMENEAILTV